MTCVIGLIEDDKYMVKHFITKLRECFEGHGVLMKDEEGQDALGGAILVGIYGQIFVINDDFQVAEVAYNYTAIGCGEEIALGSLDSTSGEPKERIELALKASEEFCNGVRGPFHIEKL